MTGRLRRLPDQLTLTRLLLAAPLWVFAVLRLRSWLGLGLLVAGLTDVLDGAVARRSGGVTRFGSQLDSVADMLIITSMVIWLRMLRPEFFRMYATPILIWATLGIATLILGWIRFRRVGDVHLWSAKVAGVLGYLFTVYMLTFDRPAAPFFWIAIGAAFVSAGETLIVMATQSTIDEHAGTVLRMRRRRRN
jgi:phosphatidylglycerophosphate synthase